MLTKLYDDVELRADRLATEKPDILTGLPLNNPGAITGNSIMNNLLCTRCKLEKPEGEFYNNCRKNRVKKKDYWCKQCHSEYSKIHNQNPEVKENARLNRRKPERRKAKSIYQKKKRKENPLKYRQKHYSSFYGISFADYFRFLKKQNYCCAICGICSDAISTQILDVDHSHSTGNVRGLLCRFCNTRLSVIEDNRWLNQAKQYLDSV